MTPSPPSKSPPQQRDPFERDKARLSRYRAHRDFFAGVQWIGKPRRAETRVVVNYARALVRKVVSYALPDPVGFEVPAPVLDGSEVGGRTSDETLDSASGNGLPTSDPIVQQPPVVPAGGATNVADPADLGPTTKIAQSLAARRTK